jgi:hypothetical protein
MNILSVPGQINLILLAWALVITLKEAIPTMWPALYYYVVVEINTETHISKIIFQMG